MSHLHSERLAALADQSPTAEEAEHLAACDECARERETHESLLALASEERLSIGVPLTDWNRLAPALRDEGLIRTGSQPTLVTRSRWNERMLRVAAALLLVTGGAYLGRFTAEPGTPFAAANGSELAALPSAEALLPEYTSVEQARAALARYELAYQHAANFLEENAAGDYVDQSGSDPDAYRTRLAALDRVGRTMREALSESPWDPVINSYYMTAMSQRAATMRQLNDALPAEARLVGF